MKESFRANADFSFPLFELFPRNRQRPCHFLGELLLRPEGVLRTRTSREEE